MKTSISRLVLVLCVLTGSLVAAQEGDPSGIRPAQLTFAYPLGTNGVNALNYSNHLSFNILFGLNGGVDGAEFGGVFNFTKGDVRWAQLAGVFNMNTGDTRGVQLAGVFNVNFNEFSGLQAAVLNYSRRVKGVQLGVVNIAESPEGVVPVGLINIIKGGHYEVEMSGGDVVYANLNYKMGVERFYSIIKAGFSSFNSAPVYSAGVGLGGAIRISEKHSINIDASTSSIIYNNTLPIDKRNALHKLDVNYKLELLPNVFLLLGPSLNVYLAEGDTLPVPYTIYSAASAGTNTSVWVGANAGLAYKF